MKKLIIMCGAPGSGKSTWVNKNLPKMSGYTVVVSRDLIRFSLVKEDEPYFSKEPEVYKAFVNLIADGLHHADNVIVDATHLNEGSRSKLFRSLSGQYGREWEVSIIVMDTCLAKCLANNENRAGTRSYVPPEQLKKMYNAFRMPNLTTEEYFDKIYIYRRDDEIKYRIIERE